jgi:hypothetical protein
VLLQERIYTAWRGRRVLSLISFDVPIDLDDRRSFRAERFEPPEQVNWYASRFHSLEQSFFLFFNADLVQRQIDSQGGAMAFVDDFTAWVTGPTVLDSERSLVQFVSLGSEVYDGCFVCFKSRSALSSLMDTKLKYKEHIARAASKGLEAAMELRRLRDLSPGSQL